VVDVEVRGLEASTVDLEVRVVVDAVNHHDVVSFFFVFLIHNRRRAFRERVLDYGAMGDTRGCASQIMQ
jgi:hypothetical protein